jgi:hypothetical protein
MYKGFVKNRKPHGKGYMINEHGTTFGEFKEGELCKELKEEDED